jgi:hypothetical protein
MKAELINLFTTSMNPYNQDVVIVFKQETQEPYFRKKKGERCIDVKYETNDICKVIMSIDNAKALFESIAKMVIESGIYNNADSSVNINADLEENIIESENE